MTIKIKLTRPELKRYREALLRYEHYLPMLKRKQQRLQAKIRDAVRLRQDAQQRCEEIDVVLRSYASVLSDRACAPVRAWSQPSEVLVDEKNIAGVRVPIFRDAVFPEARYSLFGTPPWVDRTLADLREQSRRRAMLEILEQQEQLLRRELARITQRVNLFEKVMIPSAREAVRRIRIKLGDEMTAAVGRSKIAKKKLVQTLDTEPGFTATVLGTTDEEPNDEESAEAKP